MTAYQLQLLAENGVSRQEVLGQLRREVLSSAPRPGRAQAAGGLLAAGRPGLPGGGAGSAPPHAVPRAPTSARHALLRPGAALRL